MLNYLGCTQMLFGKKVKYSVTYSTNQRSFQIHRRKQLHNFKVSVMRKDLEGAKIMELKRYKQFLVTNVDQV